MEKEYNLILDQSVLDRYNKYYFKQHPKAKKVPIERPLHPSINSWMILQRMAMNNLKQKWKDMVVWWINDLGYSNLKINEFEMTVTSYMPTKRRADPDNIAPKFLCDGFTESGFIVDDDGEHLRSLTLKTRYDKNNAHTEINIKVLN